MGLQNGDQWISSQHTLPSSHDLSGFSSERDPRNEIVEENWMSQINATKNCFNFNNYQLIQTNFEEFLLENFSQVTESMKK